MDFIICSNDKEKYWNDEVERHSKQELFAVSMRVWNPCPKCALIRDIGFLIML